MSRSRRSGRTGFTMVELLLAIVVMTVVLLAAVPSLMGGRQLSRESQQTHLAVVRLHAFFDQILLEDIGDLIDANGPYPLGTELEYGHGTPLPDETIVLTAPGHVAGASAPSVLELQLRMTWTSGQRTRALTLTSAKR